MKKLFTKMIKLFRMKMNKLSRCDSLWDLLPHDVATAIFTKLPTGDRVRLMLVCKSWRQTLLRDDIPVAAAESPWLILSDDSYNKPEYHLTTAVLFHSPSENRIYHFSLPGGGSGRWCCCGSSNGWLLMARTSEVMELFSVDIMVWNPITRSTRKLPALSTLPFYRRFVEQGLYAGAKGMSPYIKEVLVIESPVNVVAIIFPHPVWGESESHLALWTPGNRRWSLIEPAGELKKYPYRSLCFHKGRLCALIDISDRHHPDRESSTSSMTVELVGCVVEVQLIWYNSVDYRRWVVGAEYDGFGIHTHERVSVLHRLVERLSGDLAIVSVVLDARICCNSSGRPELQFHTGNLEVRAVLDNGFVKLPNIGSEAMFVGCSSSFSVEALRHGVDGERIYFATDFMILRKVGTTNEDTEGLYRIREEGVFNVKENRMQQTVSSTKLRLYSGSCAVGWFTPKLF